MFLKQFKSFAKDAGISGFLKDYALHSFRRGAVTTMVNNGCDEHTVHKQMRVTSTVHGYTTVDKKKMSKATDKLFTK